MRGGGGVGKSIFPTQTHYNGIERWGKGGQKRWRPDDDDDDPHNRARNRCGGIPFFLPLWDQWGRDMGARVKARY